MVNETIRSVLIVVITVILVILALGFVITVVFGEIDPERRCKDLTLKECYEHCKDQKYLINQDCSRIIRELKETRETRNEN